MENPGEPTKCRLCGDEGLRDSHILPDFFIRSLEEHVPKGVSGQPQPHSIVLSAQPGFKSGMRGRGLWEWELGIKKRLLCGKCETQFSRYENYFRTYFYTLVNRRLVKRDVGTKIRGPLPHEVNILGAREVNFSSKSFKLFVLSLLWRCGVADGKFFSGVNFGEQHEARLARALRAEDPGGVTVYPFHMLDVRDGTDGFVDFLEQPSLVRIDTSWRICRLLVGGFYFFIYVVSENHRLPADLMNFCLRADDSLTIHEVTAVPIIEEWARYFHLAGIPIPKF